MRTQRSIKLEQTMIKKFGSVEAWKAKNAKNAALGGRAKVPKGFALRPDLAKKLANKRWNNS